MTEYLRMSGMYWGITVMDLMGQLDSMDKKEIIDFIVSCQHEGGGFGASIGHDPHLLYTLSAIQVKRKEVNKVKEIPFIEYDNWTTTVSHGWSAVFPYFVHFVCNK